MRSIVRVGALVATVLSITAVSVTGTVLSSSSSSSFNAAMGPVVTVDVSTVLVFGNGPTEFNRATFINVHGMADVAWTPTEIATYGDGNLTAAFGRAINRPIWYLDRNKKSNGALNVTDLAVTCARFPETAPENAAHFTSEVDQLQYIESLNVAFWFEQPPASWNPADRGFFPRGNTTLMGELYTAYLDVCVDRATQGSIIVECMNEPFIHVQELNITNEDVIDAHVAIAGAIHARFGRLPISQRGPAVTPVPSTSTVIPRVAGPTTAWPEFQMGGNFSRFRETYGAFIDQAGKDMDLLSIHLYDTYRSDKAAMQTNGPWNASSWDARSIGGNVAAILDLIETVSAATQIRDGVTNDWSPTPMEVSEYGTSFAEWKTTPGFNATSRGHWAILIGVCGKTLAFIDRSDTIVKAVPFLVHDGAWFKAAPAPWALFAGPDCNVPTALTLWYEMWKGVSGTRMWSSTVPASSAATGAAASFARESVQVVVLREANGTLFVLLNNLDSWPVPSVTVQLIASSAATVHNGTSAKLRLLHWDDAADSIIISNRVALLSLNGDGSAGVLTLTDIPANAFVVAEVPLAALTNDRTVHRWRLSSEWTAPGGVTAFPIIAPKSTDEARRHVRAMTDVSRALPANATAIPAATVVAGARLCFSSFGAAQEYEANAPMLAFVNATDGQPVWLSDAIVSFAGFGGKSPDGRQFDCLEYDLRSSGNAWHAFIAAAHVPAAHPDRVVVETAVRVGSGSEPDLELSSLMLIIETTSTPLGP